MVRTRLTLLIILLVLSQLLASGFLLWTIDNARYFIDRRRISYQEVGAYFTLADTAIQHRQALLNAGRAEDSPDVLRRGAAALEDDLSEIVSLTRREIDMVARETDTADLPETRRLEEVRAPTRGLIAESRALADGLEAGWAPERVEEAVQDIVPFIDVALRDVIETALGEEDREAVAADRSASEALSQLIVVAVGVTAFGLVLGAVAIYFLTRRVRQPMGRLLAGVREFTRGQLDHRTGLAGRDEFAQLGQALDDMASQLDRQHRELRDTRNTLADTVAERTAELAEANAELRKTDQLRREFLANVSHELRTPITVIRGEADVTLRSADEPEEYRDTLRRIVSQAGHLTKLVDDLLLIARSGAGALKLDRQAVALRPLLEEAAGHSTGLGGRHAAITVEGADVSVDADRDRLTQLVMILLDNALRYGGPEARVDMAVERRDGEAELSVTDNGPGIAPEDVEHVFERFYRGDGSGRQDGSGLGLNIAKAIVDAHGGRIGIESAPGRGTTVTVALPLAAV